MRRVPCVLGVQERLEGNFRFLHAWFRAKIEPITMLGGLKAEVGRAL
jgi:ABC-type uncharacterized transport system fused permease/ATPase subunit